MEKKSFFDEICTKLNLDSQAKQNALKTYTEINQNAILQENQKHWICCAIYSACTEINLHLDGNGVSLVDLIYECNLDIFSFFEKIEIWFKVASVSNKVQEKVENLKKNFRISFLAYEEYSKMFRKLFACKDITKDLRFKRTSQDLFEMCWTLFAALKVEYPEISGDFVNSINCLLCCLDCIFRNILHDNRRDLINSTFPGLPSNFFSPSFYFNKVPSISVIDNLRNYTASDAKEFILKIQRFITKKSLAGDFNTIFSEENYDVNFKKLNDLYETFILSCGEFDERIYLSHPEFGSKFFGKSSNVQSNSRLSESALKLQALYTGGPSYKLIELLSCHSDSVLDDLKSRLDRMKEIFCTKMMLNGQNYFHAAEALYYRLLEDIIYSELRIQGRFDLFINDDLFNQTLIILCLEIILFAYSLNEKLPKLLECFNLEAFNFYKLIEVVIRNNKDYFTNDVIMHLKTIEEQCLDSLVWVSGSTLWKQIEKQKGKLPASKDAESSLNSKNSQPKSLKLFLRKFYQLAHVRLNDLCKNLHFNTNLLQKIWTFFEHSITDHIGLMKNRHLDQILMCCIYIFCKIWPNENHRTFDDILKLYRSQRQADSDIYRSVFIEQSTGAAETESRGDIIYFYNNIFVPKMQEFVLSFSISSQNNLKLSALPKTRPLISPHKISLYHDIYVRPMTKRSTLLPSERTLTFTMELNPTKDLQKINSLTNMDTENYPSNKVFKKHRQRS